MARWTWHHRKDRLNKAKHLIGFETAQLVFDDPWAVSRLDPESREERWQTLGSIGGVLVFVVHTFDEDAGRIISARKATKHESKAYEEGEF